MDNWQPMTINPQQPGQYRVRVRVSQDRFLPTALRYWDGKQWLSRNGKLPTGFGNVGDLSQQFWQPANTGEKEQ